MEGQVMYDYLKRWLSREQIRKIREGDNPTGTVLTRQQVHNIMKGKSKNFTFLSYLIKQAEENQSMSTQSK